MCHPWVTGVTGFKDWELGWVVEVCMQQSHANQCFILHSKVLANESKNYQMSSLNGFPNQKTSQTRCKPKDDSYGFVISITDQAPWGCFNIKMTSCQYGKSHCGDKTILRPYVSTMGFPILVRRHLYIESQTWLLFLNGGVVDKAHSIVFILISWAAILGFCDSVTLDVYCHIHKAKIV